MKAIGKFVSGVFYVGIVLLISWLIIGNVSKSRKIEHQEAIIHQYEDVYLPTVEENSTEDTTYQELQAAEERITELEQQSNIGVEDDIYMSIKFPTDGNYYKEAYNEVQFYSDSNCTKKLEDVRFMSSYIDSCNAENGLSIYCLRMDDGKICYCTDLPYLITEGKYNEMHTEM